MRLRIILFLAFGLAAQSAAAHDDGTHAPGLHTLSELPSLPEGRPTPSTFAPVRDDDINRARFCPEDQLVDAGRNITFHYAMMGVRHDRLMVECLPLSSLYFIVGERVRDSIPDPISGLGPAWNPEIDPAQPGVSFNLGMHRCGPGEFMTYYNAGRNVFGCRTLEPTELYRETFPGTVPLAELVVDGRAPEVSPEHFRTRPYKRVAGGLEPDRGFMHACHDGYVMVGFHFLNNVFLCGLVFPVR